MFGRLLKLSAVAVFCSYQLRQGNAQMMGLIPGGIPGPYDGMPNFLNDGAMPDFDNRHQWPAHPFLPYGTTDIVAAIEEQDLQRYTQQILRHDFMDKVGLLVKHDPNLNPVVMMLKADWMQGFQAYWTHTMGVGVIAGVKTPYEALITLVETLFTAKDHHLHPLQTTIYVEAEYRLLLANTQRAINERASKTGLSNAERYMALQADQEANDLARLEIAALEVFPERINTRLSNGVYPVQHAAASRETDSVLSMLASGAPYPEARTELELELARSTTVSGRSLAAIALKTENFELLDQLRMRPDYSLQEDLERDPFGSVHTIESGPLKSVIYMIQAGIENLTVHSRFFGEGESLLHIDLGMRLVRSGRIDVLTWVLDHRPEAINDLGGRDCTMLMSLFIVEPVEEALIRQVAEFLITRGADPDLQNAQGESARSLAEACGMRGLFAAQTPRSSSSDFIMSNFIGTALALSLVCGVLPAMLTVGWVRREIIAIRSEQKTGSTLTRYFAYNLVEPGSSLERDVQKAILVQTQKREARERQAQREQRRQAQQAKEAQRRQEQRDHQAQLEVQQQKRQTAIKTLRRWSVLKNWAVQVVDRRPEPTPTPVRSIEHGPVEPLQKFKNKVAAFLQKMRNIPTENNIHPTALIALDELREMKSDFVDEHAFRRSIGLVGVNSRMAPKLLKAKILEMEANFTAQTADTESLWDMYRAFKHQPFTPDTSPETSSASSSRSVRRRSQETTPTSDTSMAAAGAGTSAGPDAATPFANRHAKPTVGMYERLPGFSHAHPPLTRPETSYKELLVSYSMRFKNCQWISGLFGSGLARRAHITLRHRLVHMPIAFDHLAAENLALLANPVTGEVTMDSAHLDEYLQRCLHNKTESLDARQYLKAFSKQDLLQAIDWRLEWLQTLLSEDASGEELTQRNDALTVLCAEIGELCNSLKNTHRMRLSGGLWKKCQRLRNGVYHQYPKLVELGVDPTTGEHFYGCEVGIDRSIDPVDLAQNLHSKGYRQTVAKAIESETEHAEAPSF